MKVKDFIVINVSGRVKDSFYNLGLGLGELAAKEAEMEPGEESKGPARSSPTASRSWRQHCRTCSRRDNRGSDSCCNNRQEP